MIKKTLLILTTIILSLDLFSCSSFFINRGNQKLLCFNWDFPTDGNGYVFINQPNVVKNSFNTNKEKVLTWTSKYGSITFNQIGRELPYCGLNQAGLAISSTSNTGIVYPEKKDDRYVLNESQWVQYLLDNCKTIDDVERTGSLIQVLGSHPPLHYLIADANGDAAVVEYVNGKLNFYRNNEFPYAVLENWFYKESLDQYKNEISSNSVNQKSRFSKMCYALDELKKNDSINNYIDYSYGILNKAEQTITRWQVVLDIGNMEVYFNTSEPTFKYLVKDANGSLVQSDKKTDIKGRMAPTKSKRTKISFNSINFNCDNRILFRDIKDQNNVGFVDYINNVDEERLYRTIGLMQEAGYLRKISKKDIKEYLLYLKDYDCNLNTAVNQNNIISSKQ